MAQSEICCGRVKLESAGLFIGWMQFFLSIVALGVINLVGYFTVARHSCNQKDLTKSCGPIIFIIVSFLIVFVKQIFIAFKCTQGIHQRNHASVFPMAVFLMIASVMSVACVMIGALIPNAIAIVSGLIALPFFVYQFHVIYKLYKKLEDEFNATMPVRFRRSVQT